jgi:hypothetical protein
MKPALLYFLLLGSFYGCKGQQGSFGTERLTLIKEIPLPSVKGRIDHMAMNLKDQVLYIAALGNHTIEVVDIKNSKHIHSIQDVDEPQGVAYIPETNELVVASGGTGDCVFYNAADYSLVATLHLRGDADNIRHHVLQHIIYVGYGNGGIAEIDVVTHKLLREVALDAHPESFQIDIKNDRLFVNLPNGKSIAVVRLSDLTLIDTWKIKNERANFPMAIDMGFNRVMIGYRRPSVLVSYDASSGKELARSELVDDVDDVFYDPTSRTIFASGGGGAINIYKADSKIVFQKLANIPTRDGARTSLLVPDMKMLILAQRAAGQKEASIACYRIND